MSKYCSDPVWDDVVPVEQDDGGPNPLAAIAYTEGYAEAMGYLRAVMAADEMSERALQLTEDIILMNPAHYTIWLYRARILQTLHSDLVHEILWLNAVAVGHPKNYQIWHHRQFLIERLDSPSGEIAFVNRMLRLDAKNYHVWSYRQWLVRRFGLWESRQTNGRGERYEDDDEDEDDGGDEEADEAPALVETDESSTSVPGETTELEETEQFILDDVRNNSAWNHRFFLVSNTPTTSATTPPTPAASTPLADPCHSGVLHPITADVYDREVNFAQAHIRRAPQNQSPWNYIRGLAKRYRGDSGVDALRGFCEEFVELYPTALGLGAAVSDSTSAPVPSESWPVFKANVTSSHALHLLAEIWARTAGCEQDADRALVLLAEKYDPVRANYWEYLRETWGLKPSAGGAPMRANVGVVV